MPATCTQCTTPATHGFRPASTPENREPDFEPRCDAHGYGAKRRLSGVVLGLLVALVRRVSSLCTAEGVSITVTVTPEGAAVRFDGDVVPDHIAAKPGPDGWRYLDIEGVPVSVSWQQP